MGKSEAFPSGTKFLNYFVVTEKVNGQAIYRIGLVPRSVEIRRLSGGFTC
jgi:hypothetical protein